MSNKSIFFKSSKAIFILPIILFLTNCGVKKPVVETEEPPIPIMVDSAQERPEDYLKYVIDFETFNAQADVTYSDRKQTQNLNVNIKMIRDIQTYISAQALGGIVEAAAALATPDSLYAVDRINRNKYALPYQKIEHLFKLPLHYISLQNLLVGNPLMILNNPSNFIKNDSTVIISFVDNTTSVRLIYNRRDKRLLQQEFVDLSKKFSAIVRYSEYMFTNKNVSFASAHTIDILHNDNPIAVTLNFSTVKIDEPVEIKFNLPTSYRFQEIPEKK